MKSPWNHPLPGESLRHILRRGQAAERQQLRFVAGTGAKGHAAAAELLKSHGISRFRWQEREDKHMAIPILSLMETNLLPSGKYTK